MKLYLNLLLFILFLTNQHCKESNPHGFDKGLKPIMVDFSRELTSKDCGSCHEEIYEEWSKSRHKAAFTNELYKESHSREPLTWCTNCHAPFLLPGDNPDQPEKRFLKEEGVSCIVCHQRGNKILTTKLPKKVKEHQYLVVPSMGESEFCANCHQFNFPTGTGRFPKGKFQFSHQPMQDTYHEWKSSIFNEKENCQSCHMQYSNTKWKYRTHLFPGGHSKEFLEKTFEVTTERLNEKELEVKILAKNLGHSFPTGDLFRKLVLRLLDKNKSELYRIELAYQYDNSEEYKKDPNLSSKVLKKKEIFFPPYSSLNSTYTKRISGKLEDLNNLVEYELSMFYVTNTNHFSTHLDHSITSLKISNGKIDTTLKNKIDRQPEG